LFQRRKEKKIQKKAGVREGEKPGRNPYSSFKRKKFSKESLPIGRGRGAIICSVKDTKTPRKAAGLSGALITPSSLLTENQQS